MQKSSVAPLRLLPAKSKRIAAFSALALKPLQETPQTSAHTAKIAKKQISVQFVQGGSILDAALAKRSAALLDVGTMRKGMPKVMRAPFTCNGCPKNTGCNMGRYYYRAKDAQSLASIAKTASRGGIDAAPEIAEAMAAIIRPLLAKGQSPGQICPAHAHELPISRRAFYRYVEQGLFGLTAPDPRRKPVYKKRGKERGEDRWIVPAHRLYGDFLALEKELRSSVVEMDCVCRTKDDISAILTLHFKSIRCQIGICLIRHNREHVVGAFDWLEEVCGSETFAQIFSLILTDWGLEFRDSEGMEKNGRCRVYYCDARQSQQKGSAEKNHVELRKKIPKGTRLDKIGQAEVSEAFSHVNSTPRRSLFGEPPMQLAKMLLPQSLFEHLGLKEIPPDEVDLRP